MKHIGHAAIVLTLLTSAATARQANRIGIDSTKLLQSVVTRTMPVYPAASARAGKHGVFVADVLVGEDGRIITLDVLQSPDERIAQAARTSLMQWTFKPWNAPNGQRAIIRSKVILYFTISGGKGLVLDPDAMAARMGHRVPAAPVSAEPPVLDLAEWHRSAAPTRSILLDVRKRPGFMSGHLPGALNIPEEELSVRGKAELPADRRIVLDCAPAAAALCPYAVRILQRNGFTRIAILKRDDR